MGSTVTAAGNSQPTALSYGLLQGFGTFTIAADTDGSQTEFAVITSGYGVTGATASNGLAIGFNTLTWKNNNVWHAGNLTNLNQLTNGPGYLTSLPSHNHDGVYMKTNRTLDTINTIDNGGDRYNPSVNNPTNEHYAVLTYGNGGNVTGQLATHFVTGQLYSRGYNSSWSSWKKYDVEDSGNWGNTISGTATNITAYTINQSVGSSNAPTFAGGTINGSLYVNANDDVTTLAGSLTLYSSGNATTSMIMFKNTTGLGYGNHGAITGDYNTYFVMDTTNRGWIFRNATTSANVASISNTGVISATRFTTSSGQTCTMSGNAYPVSPNSYFGLRHGSMGASSAEYMIISANADTYISCATGSSVYLRPNANNSASGVISETGAFRPETNNSINLGTASYRWANLYTNDLHLSNEGKEGGNEIDGTTGDWTLQEGEENLYIINHKNGKKYKIDLTEI
jgi:hypothetical protein